MKDKLKICSIKYKNIWKDVCFGFFVIANFVAVSVLIEKFIKLSKDNISDILKYKYPFFSDIYEQSEQTELLMVRQNINIVIVCTIIASLLYSKHKKMAFLCLLVPIIISCFFTFAD